MNKIEFSVSRESARALEEQLYALSGEKVHAAMSRAAKRAASHAKTIGTKLVRRMYTIDAWSIKRASVVYPTRDGAVFKLSGPRVSIGHYNAKTRKTSKWWKKDIFVSVKKGSGNIVSRAYAYSNTFWRREKGMNYFGAWGERMFGPAVPQLFGNNAIKNEIADEAMKKYEERIRHEVGRLIGV